MIVFGGKHCSGECIMTGIIRLGSLINYDHLMLVHGVAYARPKTGFTIVLHHSFQYGSVHSSFRSLLDCGLGPA